eukprot:1295375-Pleurochrysis_carterae.AAC.1
MPPLLPLKHVFLSRTAKWCSKESQYLHALPFASSLTGECSQLPENSCSSTSVQLVCFAGAPTGRCAAPRRAIAIAIAGVVVLWASLIMHSTYRHHQLSATSSASASACARSWPTRGRDGERLPRAVTSPRARAAVRDGIGSGVVSRRQHYRVRHAFKSFHVRR